MHHSLYSHVKFAVADWMETFISWDLEPVLPSGKGIKPQHPRQLHMQATNEQERAF